MNNLGPYDINIVEAYLINFEGNILDISNIMTGFEISENIFSSFMTAGFSFTNAIGIIEKFPIIGEEFLYISFEGQTSKKTKQWLFMVDSIVERSEANDKTETFILSCQSPEWLSNKFSSVTGSYIGMPINEIVEKIYKDILSAKIRFPAGEKFNVKSKKIKTDKTDGIHSFVGFQETPLDFIQRLTSAAQSQRYKESDYLFFETSEGFNFRSVSSLLTEPVKEDYHYDVKPLKNSLDTDEIKNYQAIQTLTFNNSVDVLNNIDMGLYDNEVCYIDLLTKTYKEKRFIYDRDYKKTKFTVLGSNKLTTKNSIFSKEHPASPISVYMMSHDVDSYQLPYIKSAVEQSPTADPYTRWPTKRHEFFNAKISKAAQLVNTLSVSILVPGNTVLKAGDLVNVYIPEKTTTTADAHKYNHFLGSDNPTCLVTSVKHIFATSRFMTILKCVKPGYEGKIKGRDI